jgi:hypothetical protein
MFVCVKDVRSVLGMQESSFWGLLTDAGSGCCGYGRLCRDSIRRDSGCRG